MLITFFSVSFFFFIISTAKSGDTLCDYMFVRSFDIEWKKKYKYRVGNNIFPMGSAAISKIINDKFYTKLKPVQNGIYPYELIRVMKTFCYQILKISRILWIIGMGKCSFAEKRSNELWYKSIKHSKVTLTCYGFMSCKKYTLLPYFKYKNSEYLRVNKDIKDVWRNISKLRNTGRVMLNRIMSDG